MIVHWMAPPHMNEQQVKDLQKRELPMEGETEVWVSVSASGDHVAKYKHRGVYEHMVNYTSSQYGWRSGTYEVTRAATR